MPIARKPPRKPNDGVERAAADFIGSAGRARRPAMSDQESRARKTPVMVRFDSALLRQVDDAARKRGVSRSAWIQYTLSRALEAGEG